MPGKKTKGAGQKTQKPASKKKPKKRRSGGPPPDPRKLRTSLVNSVLRGGKEIIAAVLDEAKKGHYLPAKYLFEFAGIAEPLPDIDAEATARVRSLAEILLNAVQNGVSAEQQETSER